MKKLTILLAMVLAATCAWAFNHKDEKATSAKVVDSGSFGIFISGKRIGTEKFQIEQGPDGGTLNSEIKVDDGETRAEQSAEMQVAANGNLKLYKWRSTAPQKEESVIEPQNDFLIEHITPSDQKKRDFPYLMPPSSVVLDDNFFSQRELLVWRYLVYGCRVKDNERSCGPSHFGVLVPRQHAASDTVLELVGREQVTFKNAQVELNKIKLDADGSTWFIWVDDNYKVIKMAIPANNVEVWRD